MTTGITLALNAAEARLQIAAADSAGDMLFTHEWQAASRGTELLAPALHDALRLLGIPAQSVARIACVYGPGNFTGIRLVLVTTAGLSRAIGAEQGGIPYLPLLARNALSGCMPEQECAAWALTHARRGLVYGQGFRIRPPASPALFTPVCEVAVLRLTEDNGCAAFITRRSASSSLLLFGSGVTRNEEYFAATLPHARRLPPCFNHPAPAALLAYAHDIPYGHDDIAPMYARPCDAEENLPKIAQSLGRDPQESRQKFQKFTSMLPIA